MLGKTQIAEAVREAAGRAGTLVLVALGVAAAALLIAAAALIIAARIRRAG